LKENRAAAKCRIAGLLEAAIEARRLKPVKSPTWPIVPYRDLSRHLRLPLISSRNIPCGLGPEYTQKSIIFFSRA